MKIWYHSTNEDFNYYASSKTELELFARLKEIIDEDEEYDFQHELERRILRADYEREKQKEDYDNDNMVS